MRKPPQRSAREIAESLANLAHSTYQTGTAQTVTSRMQSVVLSSNRRTYRGVTCGPQLRCGAQTLSALCDHVAVHLESQKMEQRQQCTDPHGNIRKTVNGQMQVRGS